MLLFVSLNVHGIAVCSSCFDEFVKCLLHARVQQLYFRWTYPVSNKV